MLSCATKSLLITGPNWYTLNHSVGEVHKPNSITECGALVLLIIQHAICSSRAEEDSVGVVIS